jgi:hypothetical protein
MTLIRLAFEISDLTADDNYPALKARYKSDLELIAVTLRSDRGHRWVDLAVDGLGVMKRA